MYLFLSVTVDLFSDLDKGSGQGVVSYDISTSTLNEVFMKVEGKSTVEQGKSICIVIYNHFPKVPCVNLVFITSYTSFTLRKVTNSTFDLAV